MANSASTLRNGLKILDLLKDSTGLRLTEISTTLQLNKTTTFRLLSTLVELNYVKKIANYYSLTHPSQPTESTNQPFIPVSRSITDQFQTTAFIGVLQRSNVVITQVLPVKVGFEEFKVLGNITPVNLSALGKAIVAFLEPKMQKQTLDQLTYQTGTKYTLTDQLTFQKNLQIINEKGYAIDDEESTIGIRCLAVPVYRDQKVIASLGISGTFDRLPRQKLQTIARTLIKSSQEITNKFF